MYIYMYVHCTYRQLAIQRITVRFSLDFDQVAIAWAKNNNT